MPSLPFGRITGKNVTISGFSTAGHINMGRKATAHPVFASNTGGGADRDAGNIFLSGYIYAYGHTPPTFPGQCFGLGFTVTGINSAPTTGELASATAVMCTGLEIIVPTYDPRQKNRIYYIVHFGPAGYDLTINASASPMTLDTNTPAFFNVKGLGVTLDGTSEDGVEESHLHIRNLAEPDLDSAYNGVWYIPSGNLDWSLQYRRAITNLTTLPALNSIHTIGQQVTPAVGTTPATAWTLAYGRVMEAPDGTFDRESNKVVTGNVLVEKCMSGSDVGTITTPAGIAVWP